MGKFSAILVLLVCMFGCTWVSEYTDYSSANTTTEEINSRVKSTNNSEIVRGILINTTIQGYDVTDIKVISSVDTQYISSLSFGNDTCLLYRTMFDTVRIECNLKGDYEQIRGLKGVYRIKGCSVNITPQSLGLIPITFGASVEDYNGIDYETR